VRDKLGIDVDIIVSFYADNKITVYPEDEVSNAMKYTNGVIVYNLNRETGDLFAFEIKGDKKEVEKIWEINFRDRNEMPTNLKELQYQPIYRKEEISISNKSFKKFKGEFIPLISLSLDVEQVKLHLIDPKTGKLTFTKRLSKGYPVKHPLMDLYENGMVIVLQYNANKSDKIFFIEVYLASEIADTNQENTKASLEDLMYPVITDIKIDWKVKAIKILYIGEVEYIVVLDDKNVIRFIKTENLVRSNINEISNVKEVQVPDNLTFREPVSIEYDKQTKNMLIHGLDLYSFQFP